MFLSQYCKNDIFDRVPKNISYFWGTNTIFVEYIFSLITGDPVDDAGFALV